MSWHEWILWSGMLMTTSSSCLNGFPRYADNEVLLVSMSNWSAMFICDARDTVTIRYSCFNVVLRNSSADWTFLGPQNCAMATYLENSTHFRHTQGSMFSVDEILIPLGTSNYTMSVLSIYNSTFATQYYMFKSRSFSHPVIKSTPFPLSTVGIYHLPICVYEV